GPRHRKGPRGRVLLVPHQADQGVGVHAGPRYGVRLCAEDLRRARGEQAAVIDSARILEGRLLVVDDQEANVLLLERALAGAGYRSVTSTRDPRAVCELHRKNRYGLILLDLQMPGMDGFQVMEGLKEIEGNGYLPVLVITAQPDHKLRALQAGAKDFVSKPFDLAELRARVHNILEVRLLHRAAIRYSHVLEETVRELEDSREVIRLKTLEEQERHRQELALAQETQESLLP